MKSTWQKITNLWDDGIIQFFAYWIFWISLSVWALNGRMQAWQRLSPAEREAQLKWEQSPEGQQAKAEYEDYQEGRLDFDP